MKLHFHVLTAGLLCSALAHADFASCLSNLESHSYDALSSAAACANDVSAICLENLEAHGYDALTSAKNCQSNANP